MSVENEILRIQRNIASTYTKVAEKGGEVPTQPTSANLAAAVASIPAGGAAYTAGDGITIDNSEISVTTPVRSVLTQEEFDALPAEQQNKGLYVIKDGGGSSGGEGEVYSTEETRIGTWIDGKPLYRQVIVSESVTSLIGEQWTLIQETYTHLMNMDTPTYYDVMVLQSSNHAWCDLPYADGYTFICPQVSVDGSTAFGQKGIYVFANNLIGVEKIVIVIEYTKTTDQPEVTS